MSKKKKTLTFSKHFKLGKTQAELDFVDIDLENDIPLYIDPYAVTTRDDDWSEDCETLIVSFFEEVIAAIRAKNTTRGIGLLSHLNEPEETKLGVSAEGHKGRGIGEHQAHQLFRALQASKAASTGVLRDISDFALFIPQIGRDKISDMTTNIIRRMLISYTQYQCLLYGIPMTNVTSGFFWSDEKKAWMQEYVQLPVHKSQKIILVPKYMVRHQIGVDHSIYRSKFVLEYLQAEHLRADDSLVTVLRDRQGKIRKKVVYKKTVDNAYPKTKDFLAEFSVQHPEVIDSYKDKLKSAASVIPNILPDTFSEAELADHLLQELVGIQPGAQDANKYHNLMIGILSFLFFPNLIYPKKEAEINEGRKRIDISYTNGKESGLFRRVSLDQDIKANTIPVECKNYTNDIANPEFDQLLGRFDHNRGEIGLLCYRESDNQGQVMRRCKDAAKSKRGIILPIDDAFIRKALGAVAKGDRKLVDKHLDDLFQEVIA